MNTEISMNDSKNLQNEEKNAVVGGTLYLVGTPIGNLSDISERAIKTLAEVDFVAAEDTRVSGMMLMRFGMKKPMINYFEHNKKEKGEEIAARLLNGESCALVTDAGMPAISDPGEDIVALCAEKGIPVSVIPGPCAAITALAVSGLSTKKFTFEGFLPVPNRQRKESLDEIKSEKHTIIIYEAPHKLKKTLDDLLSALGDRKLSLCRELTKLNEEIIRTTISGAIKLYEEKEPRGEYVLVIEGAPDEADAFWLDMTEEEHVDYYVSLGQSKNEAMKSAAKDRGVGKSEIYNKIMKKD